MFLNCLRLGPAQTTLRLTSNKAKITAVSLFPRALLPVPFFSSDHSRFSFYTTWSIRYNVHYELSLKQLSTVEPRLTTTPLIRPPRYYGHILSNQT